ncbi:MAG: dTDP-4-dehydrorhamnose 3,5-epimerase [Pseudomonadota bacterium]
MDVQRLAIPDVVVMTPKKFGDARGFFSETFNVRTFEEVCGPVAFVQDNQSLSAQQGTVRGLHFQTPPHAQAKLVRVLRGAILDVAVDLRRGSATYGHHVSATLSAENWAQMFVPVGFAHGFCTLTPDTEVLYKVSGLYSPGHDKGLAWDDPALGIAWPVAAGEAVLSDKDRKQPKLAELEAIF